MRVLVLSELYPPHYLGGYELKCAMHVQELARRGHEVTVLTSRWRAQPDENAGNVWRLLHFDPLYSRLRLNSKAEDPSPARRRYGQLQWAAQCRHNYRIARAAIQTLQPDVVYAWQLASVSIQPLVAAWDAQVPTLLRVDSFWLAYLAQELYLEPSALKRRYRMLMFSRGFKRERAGPMLVVSDAVRRRHLEVGFGRQSMTVMPEGVPAEMLLAEQDLAPVSCDGPIRLLFAGRLEPEKGPQIAIEAMGHLVNACRLSDVYLDVAGLGPQDYVAHLADLARRLGVADRVSFLGFMEHSAVLARLPFYRAVLIPSLLADALPGSIAEAMARGVPVIASTCGGAAEIITDGESGFLVPAGDAAALGEAAGKLITDAALAHRFRLAGLRTVRQGFVHERLVDRAEACLQELASAARGDLALQGNRS